MRSKSFITAFAPLDRLSSCEHSRPTVEPLRSKRSVMKADASGGKTECMTRYIRSSSLIFDTWCSCFDGNSPPSHLSPLDSDDCASSKPSFDCGNRTEYIPKILVSNEFRPLTPSDINLWYSGSISKNAFASSFFTVFIMYAPSAVKKKNVPARAAPFELD